MRALLGLLAPAAVLAAVALAGPALTGCDSGSSFVCDSDDVYAFEDTTPVDAEVSDVTVGAGECVVVRYEGRLAEDGTVFDASPEGGRALPVSGLIRGFQQGLVGRRVGESFRITVPPELGYGTTGTQTIPSCSTLEFDVTVLDTAPPAACR
jgi:hypothetical protein